MDITGQVIVRDTTTRVNGKRVLMVVGLLAVPDDFLENHHQYTVAGNLNGYEGADLVLYTEHAVDRDELAKGTGLGHLLTQPIWRV